MGCYQTSLVCLLLLFSADSLCAQTAGSTQRVPWGYRPTKGQTLHFTKNQRMDFPGHISELTINESFEVHIIDIDSVGSFLFKVRCTGITKVPDSSGMATAGSVFHGQSPLCDGTFAEISVLRNGEYVAGRFDQEPAYQKKRKKARDKFGVERTTLESDRVLLKHLANDLFPRLCDSTQCTVGSIWIDSVGHRMVCDPTELQRVEFIYDSSIAPHRWYFGSTSYYGTEKCAVLNVRPIGMKPVPANSKLPLVGHQNLYIRLSDGMVQSHEAEVLGVSDAGKQWRNVIQYNLVPKGPEEPSQD